MIQNILCIFCNKILEKEQTKFDENLFCFNKNCMYGKGTRFRVWIKNNEIYNYVIRYRYKNKYYSLVGRDVSKDNEVPHVNLVYHGVKLSGFKIISELNYFIPLQMDAKYIKNLIIKLIKLSTFQ